MFEWIWDASFRTEAECCAKGPLLACVRYRECLLEADTAGETVLSEKGGKLNGRRCCSLLDAG